MTVKIISRTVTATSRSKYTSSAASSNSGGGSSIIVESGSGSSVDIIATTSSVKASDSNIFSALYVQKNFLPKDADGSTAGVIDFTAGIKVGGDSISAIIKSTDSLDLSDVKVISAAKANTVFARKDIADTFAEDMTFNKGINVADIMKAAAATIVGIATIGTVNATTLNADTGTIPTLNATTATVSQSIKAGSAQITADLTVGGKTTTLNAVVNNLATTYQLSVSDTATILRTIVKDYISSDTYIPGFSGSGFKLWNNGGWNLELDTLTVRKVMNIFELIINKIRSVNGGLIVSPGNGKINSVSLANSVYTIGIDGDMTFVANDLVRCQTFRTTGSKYYWVQVQSVTDNNITVNQSDFGTAVPEVGDELVQMGNTTDTSRQGCLYLVANEDGKPRIEALNGINSTDLTGKAKAIFGNLDGITDTDFTSISGYGLYAENVYLKGSFILKSGKTIETAISDAIDGSSQTYVTQSTYSTEIKALTDSISAKVSQTDFDSLGDVVSGHTSTLSQLSNTIDARITKQVSTGGSIYTAVADSFTMSSDGTVSLFGKTINITGATIFSSLASKNDVNAAVNNVQIGGTNLLLNSSLTDNLTDWTYDPFVSTIYDSSLQMANSSSKTYSRTQQEVYNIEGSTLYTFSIYIKSLTSGALCGVYLWENNGGTTNYEDNYHSFNSVGWHSFTIETQPDCTFIGVLIQLETASATVQYRYAKLEQGNKATSWSPAIADTNSAITTAQSNAEGYTDSLKNSLKSLAYKDAVSAAMLDTSVINGGYILTSLIKASDLVIASGQITGLGSLATASSVSTSQITGLGGLALKDTIGKAQLDSTIISGAYISTSLLNVQEIVANGIWAQTINAGNATFSNITMTSATVTGTITANNGAIGKWTINSDGTITTYNNNKAMLGAYFDNGAKVEISNYNYGLIYANSIGATVAASFNAGSSNGTALLATTSDLSGTAIYGSGNCYFITNADSQFVHVNGNFKMKNENYDIYAHNGGTLTLSNSFYSFILCTAAASVYLPSNPTVGKKFYVCRFGHFSVTVYGNGYNIYAYNNGGSSSRGMVRDYQIDEYIFVSAGWVCGCLTS